jgi:hypothetical protein
MADRDLSELFSPLSLGFLGSSLDVAHPPPFDPLPEPALSEERQTDMVFSAPASAGRTNRSLTLSADRSTCAGWPESEHAHRARGGACAALRGAADSRRTQAEAAG